MTNAPNVPSSGPSHKTHEARRTSSRCHCSLLCCVLSLRCIALPVVPAGLSRLRPEFKMRQDKTNVYVSIGWLFFLLRRAQPHIHIWHALAPIWPFSVSTGLTATNFLILPILYPFLSSLLSPPTLQNTVEPKPVVHPEIGTCVLLAGLPRQGQE